MPAVVQRAAPVIWITGMSGVGKSTLGAAISAAYSERRIPCAVLDGDEVRAALWPGLGFSRSDRDANVARLAWIATHFAKSGTITVVSAISPYRAARLDARKVAEQSGVPFFEVFLTAELEVLRRRDPKGLYRKALSGEIRQLSGISDPYEPPEDAEICADTGVEDLPVLARRVVSALETVRRGWEPL